MTRLRAAYLCASGVMASARHWSEHEGLGRALSFLSHESVHPGLLGQILLLHAGTGRWSLCDWSRWYWSMVLVNWLLIGWRGGTGTGG